MMQYVVVDFFLFFRETPTSPWVPFQPLGRLFRPSRPLSYSLCLPSYIALGQKRQILMIKL